MKKLTVVFYICAVGAASAGDVRIGLSNGIGYIGPDFAPSYVPGGLLSVGTGEKGEIMAAVKYYEYYRTTGFDGAGVVWEKFLVVDFGFAYDFASFHGYEAGAEIGFSKYNMSIRYVGRCPGTPYTDTDYAKETGPGPHGSFRITRNLSDHIAARSSLSATLINNGGTYSFDDDYGPDAYHEYKKNGPDIIISLDLTVMARLGTLSLTSNK